MKLLSKLSFPVLLLGLLFLAVRGSLFSRSPIVIVLQLLALALNVSARRAFAANQFRVMAEPGPGAVLRRGPYRLIRHPMYAGALLFLWTGIVAHWSLVPVVVGLVATLLGAIRVVDEERRLAARFPDYAAYAERTKRIIPFVLSGERGSRVRRSGAHSSEPRSRRRAPGDREPPVRLTA
jgi:protein-S-isoprenylcysteine O-methyltransferase Ste14